MAQTQFFKRESNNIEEYKKQFIETLTKVETVRLFPIQVVGFLRKWINAQTNYIPRDDVDNFPSHLKRIFKQKDFYEFIVGELQGVNNNGKIQEYSFNLISQLDESAQKYEKFQKKKSSENFLNNQKQKSKKEDEKQMQKILGEIGDL